MTALVGEARGGLIGRLRAETRSAHDRIERDLDWTARLASRAAYAGWLAGLAGFHRPWEEGVAPWLDPGFFAARRRSALLVADLAWLGWDRGAIGRIGLCPVPAVTGRAQALGSLYVLEGSRLGGQVIAREAERRLGVGPQGGCAYFRGHGQPTGRLWQGLQAELARLPEPEEDEAVEAALATFDTLRRWLCREDGPAFG